MRFAEPGDAAREPGDGARARVNAAKLCSAPEPMEEADLGLPTLLPGLRRPWPLDRSVDWELLVCNWRRRKRSRPRCLAATDAGRAFVRLSKLPTEQTSPMSASSLTSAGEVESGPWCRGGRWEGRSLYRPDLSELCPIVGQEEGFTGRDALGGAAGRNAGASSPLYTPDVSMVAVGSPAAGVVLQGIEYTQKFGQL